jgi:hypothetical protein
MSLACYFPCLSWFPMTMAAFELRHVSMPRHRAVEHATASDAVISKRDLFHLRVASDFHYRNAYPARADNKTPSPIA